MSEPRRGEAARVSTAPMDRRLDGRAVWAIAALLLLLHAVLAWGAREIALLTAQDDGRYMILARSLQDLAYRDLNLVGAPPHAVYPPGYPALLAAWGAVAGSDWEALLLPTIACSVAALAVAFAAIRRAWSPAGALLCLACLAVNPFLVTRAGSVRSEPLYTLLALLALWAVLRHATGDPVLRRDTGGRALAVAGAAAIAAALTRTIGVVLIVALGVDWVLRGRWRAVGGLAAAALATVGAWLGWTAVAPNQYEGVHYFADVLPDGGGGPVGSLVARVAEQVPGYAVKAVQTIALPTVAGTPWDNVAWGLVVAVGLGFGLVALYRRWRVAAIYLVLYAVVLVLWPYQHTRFLEPVIPLLVLAALLGVGTAVARLRPSWGPVALVATAVAVFAGSALETGHAVATRQACGSFSLADPPACIQADRASYLRALHHIEREMPEDAVFLTAKTETLYLYTGRRAVLLESTLEYEPARYAERLAKRGVDGVILGSLHVNEPAVLHDRLMRDCEDFEVEAFFEPRTWVLRPRPGSAGGSTEATRTAGSERARTAESKPARTAGSERARTAGFRPPDACAAMQAYEEANRRRNFSTDSWFAG